MNQMITRKNALLNNLRTNFQNALHRAKLFKSDNKAEGYLDMAMKILIVVVIGAAILAIMNTAMPNLFQSLIDKITSELSGVTVLP